MAWHTTSLAVTGWLVLAAGFLSMPGRADDNREFQDYIIREINKQRVAYTEDMRTLREQNAALSSEVTALSELLQDMRRRCGELENRISELERENENVRRQQTETVDKIKSFIATERQSIEERRRPESPDAGDKPAAPAASYRLYTVVAGDTLGAIAQAFGVSLSVIKQMNELDNDKIYVGQKLKIPETPDKK